jgi:hypothetical protein
MYSSRLDPGKGNPEAGHNCRAPHPPCSDWDFAYGPRSSRKPDLQCRPVYKDVEVWTSHCNIRTDAKFVILASQKAQGSVVPITSTDLGLLTSDNPEITRALFFPVQPAAFTTIHQKLTFYYLSVNLHVTYFGQYMNTSPQMCHFQWMTREEGS